MGCRRSTLCIVDGPTAKRFAGGLKKEKIYNQGFHIVAPWNDMIIFDTRINEGFEEMDVLSKNGLSIKVELSYRYFPLPNKIGYLYDEIGKDYVNRIIKPEIRSATREVIGKYLPEELYSTKREAIQDQIDEARSDINPHVSELKNVGNVRLNTTAPDPLSPTFANRPATTWAEMAISRPPLSIGKI